MKEQKRYINRGRRFGMRFLQSYGSAHSIWSLGELYGRPIKWARIFVSRQAGRRIEEDLVKLRTAILDCLSADWRGQA